MSYRSLWKKHALLREGEKLTAYLDTVGVATVGIGHKLLVCDKLKVGDKITKERSDAFFKKDSALATIAAKQQAKSIGIESDWFIAALISVNFQLGINWTRVFYGTYPAIVSHDFDKAINNLRRSDWYKQTPVRVEDFIAALERAKSFKNRPLKKTRTMQGASITGLSVVAAEVKDSIEPLAGYSDILQYVFIGLALFGVILTIYARIDDRNKGKR